MRNHYFNLTLCYFILGYIITLNSFGLGNQKMLSLYVNYRASSFVFCLFLFFLKNKELLKFEPPMSFLLDETSQQKGVSQFLINWFFMCKTHQHQPMVSMHLSSFAMPVVAQIILIFLIRHRALVKRLLSQGYKVNRLSNTFKKFYGRHTELVGQYKKNVCQMFADSISWNDFLFWWICQWPN